MEAGVSPGDTAKSNSRRLTVLALLLVLGFAVIVGQLFRYQVVQHSELSRIANAQVKRTSVLPARRGYISDANGHILAMDLVEWDVSVSPTLVRDANRGPLAGRLAPLLELPEDEIYAKLLMTTTQWVPLKTAVPQAAGEQILALGESGVICVPRAERVYPEGSLTAHVLGIVSDNGDGYYGVEGYYDKELRPTEGVQQYLQEGGGGPIPASSVQQDAPRDGESLVLTLDLNIQYIAAQELGKALEAYEAESGTALVLDPRTGAILASVSLPTYDPSDFTEASLSLAPDPAVSEVWEPGSIFKLVTWGGGLDAGVISPGTTMMDNGYVEVGGRVFTNWDNMAHGLVTMTEALARSLNVIAASISTAMGKDAFYTYVRRFGFGSPTGVDLEGEVDGMVKLPGDSDWFPSELGANAFGQGVAVTPMQMVAAVAVIANDGLLVRPHITKEIVTTDPDGRVTKRVPIDTTIVRRAISSDAAQSMREMMVNAVESFAKHAQVPGYRTAGKSATAQIPIPGGYDPYLTIASYVGFVPADDPRFVILVKLDKPKKSEWGTQTAAYAFEAIAERLLLYLQVPPDDASAAALAREP